jgi:hypothetical protein
MTHELRPLLKLRDKEVSIPQDNPEPIHHRILDRSSIHHHRENEEDEHHHKEHEHEENEDNEDHHEHYHSHEHSDSPDNQISFEKLEAVLTRNDLLILCCFVIDEDEVEYIKIVNTQNVCHPFFVFIGSDLRLKSSEKYRNIHISQGKDVKKRDLVFRDYYHKDVITHTSEQIERLQLALDSNIIIVRGTRLSVMRHGEPRIYFFHETTRACLAPLVKLKDLITSVHDVLSHVGFVYVKIQSLYGNFIDDQFKLYLKRLLDGYDKLKRKMEETKKNVNVLCNDFDFLQTQKDSYRLAEAIMSKMTSEFIELEQDLVEDQM